MITLHYVHMSQVVVLKCVTINKASCCSTPSTVSSWINKTEEKVKEKSSQGMFQNIYLLLLCLKLYINKSKELLDVGVPK